MGAFLGKLQSHCHHPFMLWNAVVFILISRQESLLLLFRDPYTSQTLHATHGAFNGDWSSVIRFFSTLPLTSLVSRLLVLMQPLFLQPFPCLAFPSWVWLRPWCRCRCWLNVISLERREGTSGVSELVMGLWPKEMRKSSKLIRSDIAIPRMHQIQRWEGYSEKGSLGWTQWHLCPEAPYWTWQLRAQPCFCCQVVW